jgi:hypothetical protein
MTSGSLSRRLALLATLASSLWLAACGGGGGGGNGSSNLRVLNLTSDLASVDVAVGTARTFTGQAASVLGAYASVDAGTYTINVNATGNASTLLTGSYSLAKDANYTAVVWGNQSSLRLSTLPEDEDTAQIASGNTRVRMFNATTETGPVDIYLTAPTADLTASTPTQSGLGAGTLSSYKEIASGTYRLRVTGVGDPTDIRLDIASVTLTAAKYGTIIYTPGAGGVLVNGTLLVQRGDATSLRNTKARVRVVASVDNGGTIRADVGGTTLTATLRSPQVLGYQAVDAGNVDVTVRVNGTVFATGNRVLTAGADYTLLAVGSVAAPRLVLLTDDNRLPASTTRAKLRMVNGLSLADPVTLSVDYSPLALDVPGGAASGYSSVAAATNLFVQATTTTSTIYQSTSTTPVNLAAQGVYTLFLLSGNTDPTAFIRRER